MISIILEYCLFINAPKSKALLFYILLISTTWQVLCNWQKISSVDAWVDGDRLSACCPSRILRLRSSQNQKNTTKDTFKPSKKQFKSRDSYHCIKACFSLFLVSEPKYQFNLASLRVSKNSWRQDLLMLKAVFIGSILFMLDLFLVYLVL